MDYDLCKNFSTVIENYPDKIDDSEEYDIYDIPDIDEYCPDGESGEGKCNTKLDKINAVCLWLLNSNIAYKVNYSSKEKVKSFIIYIMIWLSYMLNLKKDGKITALKDFYTNHIENNPNYANCKSDGKDCNSTLKDNLGYNNFKEIIFKNMDFSNINIEDISKFYEAFKLLCKLHTEYDEDNLKCTEYLGYANDIVGKFNELNRNSSISGDSSYSQVWSTLSTDYENFKKEYNVNCEGIPLFPSIKTTQHVQSYEDHSEHDSVQNYGVTSSSLSIVKKLILALSIFSAITIFLGIFYKGSLFVLRKRAQKQHLREKLKNIKKRMNH
ncbi:PIR protein [Plasmodium yoelii]|uniref:PIR protein n=2 Tax=Plasmodium yoelii TaxID=5861 RepID=A0AAF0B5G7_PLAYO|nr:PIR protein [Plasmodium yoelii]WBY58319.1 PIR protein [Plasmodium yoelii yoelii]VTZ79236.1 PIR protein [Plasmodium yoelii]|eukprot:XP_022810712.1 PIR protein [Plasmodium yoelii]